MSPATDSDVQTKPEQITYANLLFIGVWVGIFTLLVTYFLYVLGVLSPLVDTNLIIQNWGKGINEYQQITGSPHGWGWLHHLGKGDFLQFVGLALLALITNVCYLVLLAGYKKDKDWLFFAICLLEIIVLSVAASGILGSGGH